MWQGRSLSTLFRIFLLCFDWRLQNRQSLVTDGNSIFRTTSSTIARVLIYRRSGCRPRRRTSPGAHSDFSRLIAYRGEPGS
jgi:hypothetical protein